MLVQMAERDQAARQQFLATGSEADSVAAANVVAVDDARATTCVPIAR